MCAGKICDAFGISEEDFVIEQADALQAYCQTELKGIPTWVRLPEDRWPDEWFTWSKGQRVPKYRDPVVRLIALATIILS